MTDSKYFKNSEYTEAHQTLHIALINYFKNVTIFSEEKYDSSYFQVEGDRHKVFVGDFLLIENFKQFIDYLAAKGTFVTLNFVKKEFKLDIYIVKYKIDIEVDGASHDKPSHQIKDEARDDLLKEQGFQVVRFKDKDLSSEAKVWLAVKQIEDLINTLKSIKIIRRVI